MTTDSKASEISRPKTRLPGKRSSWITATVVFAAVVCWALGMGLKSRKLWSSSPPVLATAEVDRGDIAQIVTETGSVEGSDDDVVRCQVESFLTLPVAPPAGNTERRPSPAKSRGTASAAIASAARSAAGGTTAAASRASGQGQTARRETSGRRHRNKCAASRRKPPDRGAGHIHRRVEPAGCSRNQRKPPSGP